MVLMPLTNPIFSGVVPPRSSSRRSFWHMPRPVFGRNSPVGAWWWVRLLARWRSPSCAALYDFCRRGTREGNYPRRDTNGREERRRISRVSIGVGLVSIGVGEASIGSDGVRPQWSSNAQVESAGAIPRGGNAARPNLTPGQPIPPTPVRVVSYPRPIVFGLPFHAPFWCRATDERRDE